jgi:hypothetical protein
LRLSANPGGHAEGGGISPSPLCALMRSTRS